MPVEEQTQEDAQRRMYAGSWQREGQRLTIPNRQVTKLAFILNRESSGIAEPVTFTIRKVDGTLIVSKVWGNQIDLPETPTLEEVEFDTPPTINEEVRIGVEFPYGSSTQVVAIRTKLSDVKADEYHCEAPNSVYTERTTWDCAYRYTYEEPAAETAYNTKVGSPTSWGFEKCDYGGAEKCPVGSETSWIFQAPTSEGPNKTPQGGPLSFIWGSE